MKELKVKCYLGRPMGGGPQDVFKVQIQDEDSTLRILDIELSLEAFADFMSTREAKGTAKFYGDDRLGKRYENHTIKLKVPGKKGLHDSWKSILKLMDKWEKENPDWTISGHERARYNHHQFDFSTRIYSFNAARWVDA